MAKVLILGGTREAVDRARQLVDEGHDVTTALAGRTREPKPPAGNLRVGGFGGVAGLADWLKTEKIERLIDATHPFATRISANAEQAAALAGVPLTVETRPAWGKQSGDQWIDVGNIEEATEALPTAAVAFLALGSQHIGPFARCGDVTFVVRMIDPPSEPLPLPRHRLILGRPPVNWAEEAEMMREAGITIVVSRNSGGQGAYAKIRAARELGLPVIMIGRSSQ